MKQSTSGWLLRRRDLIRAAGIIPFFGAVPVLQGCADTSHNATDTVQGWLPPPAAMPSTLMVVDLNGASLNTQVAVAIMQGVVNARLKEGGEGLYVLIPSNYVGGVAFQGADAMWIDIYTKRYGIQTKTGTPTDAATLAKAAGINEYVIWDPNVPATINVANTLAWLHGTLAVSPDDATSVFKGTIGLLVGGLNLAGRGFKPFLDLRTLDFSDADAAYGWALRHLGQQVPKSLALLSVGDLPNDPTEGVIRWTPRDYAVVAHAFTWIGDLTSGTVTPSILGDMFHLVAGQKATTFGWTNNESAQTILCSSHGVNFVGADTPGLSAENLSVHSAIRTTAKQKNPPAAPELDSSGVYAGIVITDGDNISVLIDFHEGRWVDPKRGTVPVGWSMQGMAPSWTPGIARHYFDTATSNDEFVSWLPFGYPDLASFVGQPTWPEYTASVRAAMYEANLHVGQELPHESNVLSAHGAGLWDLLHGSHPPDGFFLGYTVIGGYPAGQVLWINQRPVFPMGAFGGTGSSATSQAISAIQTAIQAVQHRPLFVLVGLDNGTTYSDAIDIVKASYTEPVHFVLPGQLVTLARQAWSKGLDRAAPLGTPSEYGVRDTYFLLSAGDTDTTSTAGTYLRGTIPSQMRQASNGSQWSYAFNVEGCHQASAEIITTGSGTIQVSGDGQHWESAGSSHAPWGTFLVLDLDVSKLLPTAEIYLRFTAGSNSVFAVLDLNFWHNRVLEGATMPASSHTETAQQLNMQVAQGNVPSVSLVLGSSAVSLNILQVGAHQGDSEFSTTTLGGKSAEVFGANTASPGSPTSYLYFSANVPGWTFPETLYLTTEYYDQPAGGTLHASYNAPAPGIPGAYTSAGAPITLGGTAAWKTYTWVMPQADFSGRQNFSADFRLSGTVGVAVHKITLSLNPPAGT